MSNVGRPGGLPSNDRKTPIVLGLIAIAAFQLLLGSYAVELNGLFYAQYGPFYDSAAYDDTLAQMHIDAQNVGTLAALSKAVYSSTVVYPWVVFAPFARFDVVSRAAGIWIQVFAAAWMQLTILFYFMKIRERPLLESLGLSSAFLLIAAVFRSNGGLSDFRMDFLQYLLLTTAMMTYLIAHKLKASCWWVLLGVATGLLCLGRATAPVYVCPIFAVFAAVDLIFDKNDRRQNLLNWLLVAFVAIVLAGWFYSSNYKYLYYYYVIWNMDANARLGLSTSVAHLRFALQHIGAPMLIVCILIALHGVVRWFVATGNGIMEKFNWRPLLFSAVPLGYLVFSGSGLNPFVSIASVCGLMLFLLEPIDTSKATTPTPLSGVLVGALIFAGGLNAVGAVAQHSSAVPISIPRQQAIREIIEQITGVISRSDRPRRFVYAFEYSGELNVHVFFNTLFFDQHIAFDESGAALIGGSRLFGVRLGGDLTTTVEWSKLPGETDEEKIATLVKFANENIDFIMTPGAAEHPPSQLFYGNRYASEIENNLLKSGQWEPLSDPVAVSPIESVVVLRNQRRTVPLQ